MTAPSASISCARRAISACSAAAFCGGGGELGRQCGFVGAGLGELTCKLLGGKPRRLFLQLQLGEFVAQRLHVALERQPLLVGTAQLLREVVQMAARLAQRIVGR